MLAFGRSIHTRGARFTLSAGKKSSTTSLRVSISHREGVQLVCSRDGTILTMYRNRDLRRLRPQRAHGVAARNGLKTLHDAARECPRQRTLTGGTSDTVSRGTSMYDQEHDASLKYASKSLAFGPFCKSAQMDRDPCHS